MEVTLKDLLEAGCHFGHQSRRWNPAMNTYIYGEKDGVHIFDLARTKSGLDSAREVISRISNEGGKVLFVGTKRQAAELLKSEAERVGMPYVTERWMGGMLTNFGQIGKSVFKLKDLKEKRAKGELKKYTKREQLLIDREILKLEKFFAGVIAMDKLPEALFVVDSRREDVAVREARRMGIPVIAMVDTNCDPTLVDYVIPVNDDAEKSIEIIVKAVSDAVKPQPAAAAPKASAEEKTETTVKEDKNAEAGKEVKPKKKTTKKKKEADNEV